ncbi:MAG: mechanosensitive ion channel family protein [Syntrophomonadaceae bacterium]|nr:mechanosensitive ion channel family protein [Syntrophomonadaceae bacterium]
MGSLFAGILTDRVLVAKLQKMAGTSRFKLDDIIIGAFKGMVVAWFFVAGIYISLWWGFEDAGWRETIGHILVALVIISVAVVAARIAVGLVQAYSESGDGNLPSISIFTNLTRFIVMSIGLLVMLQYFGISITPILTALGVGGIAVALALQDTLSNVFAGIHILMSRQIKPGDYIKLDSGEEGVVADISWRTTSIRMLSNNMVLVPNLRLSGAIVTNHELPEHEMSVIVSVGVSYSSDLDQVERTVIEVAREVLRDSPGGVSDFNPLFHYTDFSDSSIDFNVVLKTKSFADQYALKHEFIKRLHRRFNQEGIEIPFPIRTIISK